MMHNDNYKMLIKKYWLEDVVHKYPDVIADEYQKLYTMVMDNEIYGSLLQIKDIFELILKIPVLIIINGIHKELTIEKSSVPKNMITIITNFFSSELSLGGWETQASSIIKENSKEPFIWTQNTSIYSETLTILKLLYSNYRVNGNLISNWRNNTIGHGALAFKEDETFYQDYEALHRTLCHLLSACFDYFSNIKIKMNYNDQAGTLLCIEGYQNIVEIYPYGILSKDNFYLFDSLSKYRQKAYILNYSHGYKQQYYPLTDHISELKERLGFIKSPNHDNLVNNSTIMTNDIQQIDALLKRDNLLIPTNLVDWLRNCTNDFNKGIFLLEAEKGIGKSTFTKMIDPLDRNHYDYHINDFQDSVIRVWNFNDTYYSRKDIFYHGLPELLRTINIDTFTGVRNQFVGAIQTQLAEYIYLLENCTSKEKPEYFAKILNKVLDTYSENNIDTEKLILVLDGIDEISPANFQELMDVIPTEDQLPPNIYILFTCRTRGELIHYPILTNWLEHFTFTTTCQYTTTKFIINRSGNTTCDENIAYQTMLKDYIQKNIMCFSPIPYDEADINLLIQKSESRFLYLYAYELIYKSTRQNTLSDGRLTIHNYLEMIRIISGDKYYNKIMRFVTILSHSPAQLTIDELLYLYGEPQLTFQTYGILTDLKCFLETEHTKKGTSLIISHAEWKSELMSLEVCKAEWNRIIDYCKSLFHDLHELIQREDSTILLSEIYSAEFWLYENIPDILNENLGVPSFTSCPTEVYHAFQDVIKDHDTYQYQFMMQYYDIVNGFFKAPKKLCRILCLLEWDLFLERLKCIFRCVSYILNLLSIDSMDDIASELLGKSSDFLKMLARHIVESQSEHKDKIMAFNLVLYHCYMEIQCGFENVDIAKQINNYDIEVYGPDSELSFYSYYLLILAHNERGEWDEAYAVFNTAFHNFKTYNKMSSPYLANCIEAICTTLDSLPNKEMEKVKLLEIALDIRKNYNDEEDQFLIKTYIALAFAYYDYSNVCSDTETTQDLSRKAKDILLDMYLKPLEDFDRYEVERIINKHNWMESL